MRKVQILFSLFFVIVILLVFRSYINDKTKDAFVAKVVSKETRLVSDNNNKGMKEIFYVVTNCNGKIETLRVEDSFWNMKFNNADIFYKIEKDSMYYFSVCGRGKGLFFDYRNILDALKIENKNEKDN